MPERYTLTQAAKLLGVSHHTLTEWLARDDITPVQEKYDRRKFWITHAQLATIAEHHDRVLRSQVVPIPRKTTRYDARETALRASDDAQHVSRMPKEDAVPAELPQGTMLLTPFATKHGIARSTAGEHEVKHPEWIVLTPMSARPGKKNHWITPDGQRQMIAFWQRNGTAWHHCDDADCPCQGL